MSRFVGRFEKQPSEILPYFYTPSDDMESGDSITAATLAIVNAATGLAVGVADLTQVAIAFGPAANGDQVVTMTLSKGVHGTSYKCTVKANSSLGFVYEDDFIIKVKER